MDVLSTAGEYIRTLHSSTGWNEWADFWHKLSSPRFALPTLPSVYVPCFCPLPAPCDYSAPPWRLCWPARWKQRSVTQEATLCRRAWVDACPCVCLSTCRNVDATRECLCVCVCGGGGSETHRFTSLHLSLSTSSRLWGKKPRPPDQWEERQVARVVWWREFALWALFAQHEFLTRDLRSLLWSSLLLCSWWFFFPISPPESSPVVWCIDCVQFVRSWFEVIACKSCVSVHRGLSLWSLLVRPSLAAGRPKSAVYFNTNKSCSAPLHREPALHCIIHCEITSDFN